MRGFQVLISSSIKAALLAALLHNSAIALDDWQTIEPPLLPGDGGLPTEPAIGEPAPTGAGTEPVLEPAPEEPVVGGSSPFLPSTGAAIGRSAGQADVSPAGEAVYSLPLALPPGTAGLAPALSLEYRHQAGSGPLGIGWSLGGLSAIYRCPRSLAQDGAAGPVTQSSADRFCLDGQRLVVLDGRAYGSVGAEYRTEIESFARVRSYGTAGAGPQRFVVESVDGRVLEFGATADSRIDWAGRMPTPRAWALNRLRDRAGNVVDYAYTEDATGGGFRLARIRYNGNPAVGVTPTHEVALSYGTRPPADVDLQYVAGAAVRQAERLERVEVFHAGELLARHELGYEAALSAAGHSRLATVRHCGRGGSECLAPTRMTWQDGVPGLGAEWAQAIALGGGAWLDETRRWIAADVNGDGRDDVIWAGGQGTSATLRYRLGQGDGRLGAEVDTRVPTPNGVGVPLDYDGNPARDLLMVSAAGRWQLVLGGAQGPRQVVDTGLPAHPVDFRGADLDGNGLSDLVWSEMPGGAAGNSLVVRARYNLPGGGFSQAPVTLYQQSVDAGYAWAEGGDFLGRPGQRIDLDGDGREDLLMNENQSIARISASERMSDLFDSSFSHGVPADVNGDGCTDFAYPHYQGRWRVRFSGCLVSGPTGVEIAGPAYASTQRVVAFDWNGDGQDDLLYADGSATWKLVQSAGDSLLPVVDTGLAHATPTSTAVADLDGDGLQDLVAFRGGRFAWRVHVGAAPDLLASVRDGFGVTAVFDYAPLTTPSVYAAGAGATYPQQDRIDARQVVSRLQFTDGTGSGSLAARTYYYAGLRGDPTRRSELGFAQRIQRESGPGGLVEDTLYRQDFPFVGQVARQWLRLSSGTPVRDQTRDWRSLSLGSGAASRQYPYLSRSVEKRFEPGGTSGNQPFVTSTMSVAAIDATSGLVTDRSLTHVEGAGGAHPGASHSTRVQHQAWLNDSVGWCLGRPQATTVTASHSLPGGNALARGTAVDWDPAACRPTRLRTQPGDNRWQVSHDLGYDAFGNLARHSVTGAGMTPRTTAIDWGARGRFPTRWVDPLSQAEAVSWEEGLGLPLTVTDANGLVTRMEYDAFGRQRSRLLPDGRRTGWLPQACAGDCDPRAVYRLLVEETAADGASLHARAIDLDGFGRALRESRRMPGGGYAVQAQRFDARGRLAASSLPAWTGGLAPGEWRVDYDDLGRPVTETLLAASGEQRRSHAYRHDGLVTTRTDSRGRATVTQTSAWGDTLSMEDAAAGRLRYDYDAFGQLLELRDGMGRRLASVGYGPTGLKISQWDTALGAWSIEPNALGEVASQWDAKGQLTRYEYDLLGRVIRRIEPEGVTAWTWGSSAAARNRGRLVAVSGPGHAESYTYDSLSRPATRSIVADGSHQYAYGYGTHGRLATLTYPSTVSGYRLRLGLEYENGQLVRMRDLAAPAAPLWELTAVDATGQALEESLGGRLRVVSGFDPVTGEMEYRQAVSSSGLRVQDASYRWDDSGNLAERRDLLRNYNETFAYDSLDRLQSALRNGQQTLGLRYDLAGNVAWRSDVCPDASDCFRYDAARLNAVVAAGTGRYAYDAKGNVTQRNGAAQAWYSYDLPRTLTANGNQASFWYAADRSRWKQVSSAGGVAETTVYIGGLLEKVTRGGKTSWRHHLPAPTGSAAVHLRHADGSAPQTFLVTRDHLGSTAAIVDAANGLQVASASFDAVGRRRGAQGAGLPTAAEMTTFARVTRDGFTGHEQLDDLGLVHMGGRVYDPAIGRFLSADPVVQSPYLAQDLDRYAYGWNNPLGVVDPTGLQEVTCLHGPNGRCQGVTVTGQRQWSRGMAYASWRSGANGQSVSAAQRDPCGQDGSAAGCAARVGVAAGWERPVAESALVGGAWGNALAGLGSAALNTVPGWYYSDMAHQSRLRGRYLDMSLYYAAMVGDVFLLGRAVAISQMSLAMTMPVMTQVSTRFGPVNPGPLSSRVASTFRSASYTARTLSEPLTVYRVIGDEGHAVGRYWTTVKPTGSLQSIIDLAIDQNWNNAATRIIRAELPAGTVIYEGATSAQRGLVGGVNQVYIPQFDPGWLR